MSKRKLENGGDRMEVFEDVFDAIYAEDPGRAALQKDLSDLKMAVTR